MPKISITFGLVLVAIGALGFLLSTQVTALIPAAFGLILVGCGLGSRKESLRMHLMHLAALCGLLGALGGLGMAVPKLIRGDLERPLAIASQVSMGVVCLIFVILCVRSFIQARKARQS